MSVFIPVSPVPSTMPSKTWYVLSTKTQDKRYFHFTGRCGSPLNSTVLWKWQVCQVSLNECLPLRSLPFRLSSIPKPGNAAAPGQHPGGQTAQGRWSEPRQVSRLSPWRCGWWGRWSPIKWEEEGTSRRDGSAGKFRVSGRGADMWGAEEGTCARERVRIETETREITGNSQNEVCVCVLRVSHSLTYIHSLTVCVCVSLSLSRVYVSLSHIYNP